MEITLNKSVNMILNRLMSFNYEAFIVGGCVRDIIMNKTPKDFDICSNATPDEIHKVFSDIKIIDTGLKHGTVTLLIDHEPYEITTYRSEGKYSDHRHPDEVSFSKTLEDDLKRRDFSINAMAYNEKENLVDLYGGQEDIKNELIRAVGNPDERIKEDALRILRAIRFASRYNFDIEQNTKEALFNNKNLLKEISFERIAKEFNEILEAENIKDYMDEYKEIFEIFIPEIKVMYNYNQNSKYHSYDLWTHTLLVMQNVERNYLLRYAALFHDIGKPEAKTEGKDGYYHFQGHERISERITSNILDRIKLPNIDKQRILQLIKWHDYQLDSSKSIKKCLAALGIEQMDLLLKLKYADELGKNTIYSKNKEYFDNIYKQIDEYKTQVLTLKDLDIDGNDIQELGFKGKEIGDILDMLLEKVLDNQIENSKKELIKYIKQLN